MNSKKTVVFFIGAIIAFCAYGQDDKSKFGISFSGFVKNDFFYDTRQTVSIREGHFLLYPAAESPDAAKKDINGKSSFNFLSIQTRLTGTITAPDAFGAKVKAVIEADFFGNESAVFVDANGFRLRHAYVQMSWKNTQLLFGQYWHPLFIPACYSEVISFNTGAPIQPFSRNPQIKIVHTVGKFSLIGTLNSQRDFTSPGGSNVLRNSALPEINGQVQYQTQTGKSKTEFLAGIGAGYKELTPLLFTEGSGGKYATDETVSSYSFTAFAKMQTAKCTVKVQGVYGSNLYDLTMLGGYAVKEVLDPNRNSVSYTPIKTMALWAEFQTSVKRTQFGLWTGYTRNLGASAPIAYYSDSVNGTLSTVRGGNIKSILRISPRAVLVSGKFNFALEAEYTNAGYAAKDENGVLYRDSQGVITRADHVSNLRVLYSVILKF